MATLLGTFLKSALSKSGCQFDIWLKELQIVNGKHKIPLRHSFVFRVKILNFDSNVLELKYFVTVKALDQLQIILLYYILYYRIFRTIIGLCLHPF